jgi:hypothetical protein
VIALLTSKQSTVWTAIEAAELKPILPVAVIGIGGLGQLAIQFLKALGHMVIAIDNRREGLDLADKVPSKLRPDLIVDYNDEDATKKVLRRSRKRWGPGLHRLHGQRRRDQVESQDPSTPRCLRCPRPPHRWLPFRRFRFDVQGAECEGKSGGEQEAFG